MIATATLNHTDTFMTVKPKDLIGKEAYRRLLKLWPACRDCITHHFDFTMEMTKTP